MNTSGRLLLFIFISLLFHGIFFIVFRPETNSIHPSVQTVSVSLKKRAEPHNVLEAPVEAEAVPESTSEPESKPDEPIVKEAVINDENITSQDETPLIEPASNEITENRSDTQAEESIGPADTAEKDLPAESSVNPFEGLIIRINSLKDSTYPLRAKKRGYQGTVVVELNIDTEGCLLSATIFRKSRYSILNSAALELIDRVFEQPYPHNTGQKVILRIPITYKLML